MKKLLLAGVASAAIWTAPAHAAFILIDDSDPFSITVTAGDFEDGFSINGFLLTSGLGNSNSVTLPDGAYSISGGWIDRGQSTGTPATIFFALAGDPNGVTSGVLLTPTSDGNNATLTGVFGGFIGGVYIPGSPTVLQDGHTEIANLAFLTVAFVSEAPPVPAPASLALLGVGLAGLGLLRRRS